MLLLGGLLQGSVLYRPVAGWSVFMSDLNRCVTASTKEVCMCLIRTDYWKDLNEMRENFSKCLGCASSVRFWLQSGYWNVADLLNPVLNAHPDTSLWVTELNGGLSPGSA